MKKTISVIIILLLVIPLTTFAIAYKLEISGDNTVEVGKKIKLKSDFVITNDMACPNNSCTIGEVSREDVSNAATWSSSDNTKASVSNTGEVTGIAEGTVT